LSARSSAFQAATLAKLYGSRIALVLNPILNFTRSDIDNQLGELGGVARARESFLCHAAIIAPCS
jgi:hypothetical protein